MCWWWMLGDTIFMPKLRVIPSGKRAPFTQQGQAKVKRLLDDLSKLVSGSPKPDDNKRRQIWVEIPHTSMNNYFSGNFVVKCVGEMGGKGR